MSKPSKEGKKNWGDEEDEDIEEAEAGPHGSGIVERVQLSTNHKGQKVLLL